MDAGAIVDSIATAASGGFNPLSILAGLIPLITHAGNAAINKYIAPEAFKPTSISEWVTMQETQIKLFTAINSADGNQETYKWVAAVKQLQRPIVATVVVLTWSASLIWHFNTDAINNFAGGIGFYLFADRTLFNFTGGIKK